MTKAPYRPGLSWFRRRGGVALVLGIAAVATALVFLVAPQRTRPRVTAGYDARAGGPMARDRGECPRGDEERAETEGRTADALWTEAIAKSEDRDRTS